MENKKYRKVSIIVTISVLMFIVLVIAFSINNIAACKMMENEVVKASGITMAEARAQVMGTVKAATMVSFIVGMIALVILAVFIEFLLVKPLKKTVRCHSAYRVPAHYTEREKKFADLLRDADKIDILKVNITVPIEEIYNVTTYDLKHCIVTEEVMQAFFEEHAVLRSLKKTPVDNLVGHISLVYELVYPISRKLVHQQKDLDKLMSFQSELPETNAQFAKIREKMTTYMEQIQ